MIELYNHQKEALEFIRRKKRCMIAFEAGVGKTYPTLEAIKQTEPKKVLIIVPKTLIEKWCEEWKLFFSEPLVSISGRPKKEREVLIKTQRNLISNYELVRIESELIKEVGFDFVVLDESQRIRGNSQIAKVCLEAFEDTPYVVLLTGTPMVKGPEDLFSQLQLIGKPWRSRYHFENLYLAYSVKNRAVYRNLDHLKAIFEQYAIKKRRAEVLDLPRDIVEPHYLDMGPEQGYEYEKLIEECVMTLEEEEGQAKELKVRNIFVRAAQISDGFKAAESLCNHFSGSSKRKWLRENLEEVLADYRHLVIWVIYLPTLDVVEDVCMQVGVPYFKIYGKVKNRDETIRIWRKSGGVLAMQIATGGVGLNLEKASLQIFWRPPFTPGDFEQAKCRLVRIGQSRQVRSIILINRGTVDVGILGLIRFRDKAIGKVTSANILDILKGGEYE